MDEDLKDIIKVIVGGTFGVILLLVVIVVGLGLASAPLEYMFCKEQAELNVTLEYEWLFWGGGCRVELPSGIWISAHDIGEYQKHLLLEEIQ